MHGVRDKFICIGCSRPDFSMRHLYHVAVWAKGYRVLINVMFQHYRDRGKELPIKLFGRGADVEEVQAEVEDLKERGRK